MKINLLNNGLAESIVLFAINGDLGIIDKFDNTNNGEHEICFTVDGVELNFLNVINSINDGFSDVVKKRAGEMYIEQYDRRSDEIAKELEKIAERLKEIRTTKFPEINWYEDD